MLDMIFNRLTAWMDFSTKMNVSDFGSKVQGLGGINYAVNSCLRAEEYSPQSRTNLQSPVLCRVRRFWLIHKLNSCEILIVVGSETKYKLYFTIS